jgi:hypothetical protein
LHTLSDCEFRHMGMAGHDHIDAERHR